MNLFKKAKPTKQKKTVTLSYNTLDSYVGKGYRVTLHRENDSPVYFDLFEESILVQEEDGFICRSTLYVLQNMLNNYRHNETFCVPKSSNGTFLVVPTDRITSLSYSEIPGKKLFCTVPKELIFTGYDEDIAEKTKQLEREYLLQLKSAGLFVGYSCPI